MKPIRIQRKRTKGWRMPPNTIYVGRPTKWGNHHIVKRLNEKIYGVFAPVRLGSTKTIVMGADFLGSALDCRTEAVKRYRQDLPRIPPEVNELRGKNLACFCPLDQPCHADVLLEIANT